jgi:hypothetical protein
MAFRPKKTYAPTKPFVSQFPTKQKVINELIRRLFEADSKRLQKWVDKLDGENRKAHENNELLGFVYLGRYYRPSHVQGADPSGARLLHGSLTGQAEAYLRDESMVDSHKAFVRQGLVLLLEPCTTNQEMRDALPEGVVQLAPELKTLTRQSDECWTLEDNPRAKRQFEKVRLMIDTYAMARLIY